MKNLNFFKYALALFALTLIYNPSVMAQEFDVGGAVRYNYRSEFYESDNMPTDNYFTFDTWRLNVDGSAGGIDISFEYRFYPTFDTHFIHHGYFGYAFNDDLYMELGVTQVPFGITTYASHSWWFQSPYYVGLEDDYDMGVNFDYTGIENMKISFAYFRQAEPQGPGYGSLNGAGRYSYDIIGGTSSNGNSMSIMELNNFNGRVAYNVNENIELGVSAQLGQTYNSALDESEWTNAFAGHIVANYGNLNFKGEVVTYDYTSVDDQGQESETVSMGAYASPYPVASEATMYVAGLAYTIPVEIGPISSIQPYVDYTFTDKSNDDFYDTQQLVPGMLITAGNIYTYVDMPFGKNHPWLTDSFGTGLGQGVQDADWNYNLNINIGYYF